MKKKVALILVILGVVSVVIGTSMAFFQYKRTGTINNLGTGTVSFLSTQSNTLNITNMRPFTSEDLDPTALDAVTITVQGATSYDEGEEYLISLTGVNNTVNGKTIPLKYIAEVSNTGSIGTSSNDYFNARSNPSGSIYTLNSTGDVTNGAKILIGFIKGGNNSINGSITIKAYIDGDRIAVSDTIQNGNINVSGYTNNVTSEWVDGRTVLTTSEWNSLVSTPISFKIRAESNEGIWVQDTLYNTIKRNVITPENPINFAEISSSSNGEGLYILPGTENDTNPIYYYRGNINNNNVIFGGYCWQMVRTTDTGGIKMIYNGVVTGNGKTCENTAHDDRIILSSVFNSNINSMSDVGYMSNVRYTRGDYSNWTTNALFAREATWVTDHYELTDASVTTPDTTHHYSCNATTASATCTDLRYVYLAIGSPSYITLTNGELVEDAIYKMTGNIVNPNVDVVTRNSGYRLNQNDSTAKGAIESWFRTNLTNEVDNTKRNYKTYLEDTIFCNDRSFKTTGSSNKYEQSGWNPNGGSLSASATLYFGTWNRNLNSWYSTTNVPSVTCPNETDRFSVSSSVAHLNYPVGLLTADEIIMAGTSGNSYTNNVSNYLYTYGYYWILSPSDYDDSAFGFRMYYAGNLNHYGMNTSFGLRPVISLKHGTEFESGGEGTPTKPYVVKYE